MQKIWKIIPSHHKSVSKLTDNLGLHPVIAQVLVNRGICGVQEAKDFIDADFSQLIDPFQLKGMKETVERLRLARDRKEKILVYGDYDVDGVTASVLLHNTFCRIGLEVVHHIPHRMTHGYGLNGEIAQEAKKNGVSLIVTVDCGINARDAVAQINAQGIDVLIIDHHETSLEKLPEALAIINPKQPACSYPFKHLAAVGLAAKVAQALFGQMTEEALDFAAIGTVADVVPLIGENRIFVKHGLARLNQTQNKGLQALMETAKILGKELKPYHVGFILGPRINAAGRMDSAQTALDLFLSTDHEQAQKLAKKLERHNAERQKCQKELIDEALSMVEQCVDFSKEKIIVIAKEGWHKGVLGIVASRITDKYYRPSIVLAIEEEEATGSARSIEGFHLHDALMSCEKYLERFGGHKGAAGLTIRAENIEAFRQAINANAQTELDVKKMIPVVRIDAQIGLADIDLGLANTIDSLQPFGEGNPEPVFCVCDVTVKSRPQVMGRETIKFWVTDGITTISAVGFGLAKCVEIIKIGDKVDLVFTVGIDDWNKEPVAQILLKDIRLSDSAESVK